MENKNRLEEVLYFLIYVCGGTYAGYHTYQINALFNPWWIALAGAIAVDVLLAYTLHCIRKWKGDKRLMAGFCIAAFLLVSSAAQVVYQQLAHETTLAGWSLWIATYAIPIASGPGSVAAIALIQFFENKVSPPEQTIATKFSLPQTTSIETPWVEKATSPTAEKEFFDSLTTSGNGNGHVEVIKRKPGRPKSVFAKDTELPKVSK